MAEAVTIARPYAEAVFRLAKEQGALTQWSERLADMSAVIDLPEVRALLGDPRVLPDGLADVVIGACRAQGGSEQANLIVTLARNERLGSLPQIRELYEEMKHAEEGVRPAQIASAFPMSDDQLRALLERLSSRFGTRLEPRLVVDPELIGGVRVTVGDKVLDASVRGRLEAMAVALKN